MILLDSFSHEGPVRRLGLLFLSLSWCLPNLLVGVPAALLAQSCGGTSCCFRGAVLVRWPAMRGLGGVCLGSTILVDPSFSEEMVLHEWGHFRQHLLLGPLYFLVIGLPSLSHAIWFKRQKRPFVEYFHFYTEAWADHLGGVYGLHRHPHRSWQRYLAPW